MDKEIILTVRVDKELKARVDRAIDRQPIPPTLSELVRLGIRLALERLEKRK